MAQVAQLPKFVGSLLAALERRLPGALLDVERIPGIDLPHYRVAVVAEQFTGKDHHARQTIVWDVADDVLSSDDRLRIASILTLVPSELEPEE
jgi:acid stress-induced BolA-like protein IbaG/YrbA